NIAMEWTRRVDRASSVDQRRPGDPECHEKPRDHDGAGGNQRVMDARPPTADAVAPETYGGPYTQNRTKSAEPCEGVEHKQQRIERVVVNGGIDGAHDERSRDRTDDKRVD